MEIVSKTIEIKNSIVFFILKIRKLKGLKKFFIGGIIKATSTHKYTYEGGDGSL